MSDSITLGDQDQDKKPNAYERLQSLTKPLKTLPQDSTLPTDTVTSGGGEGAIQKGLDRAKELAAKPQEQTQPGIQTQTTKPEPKPTSQTPGGDDQAGELDYASKVQTFEGGSSDAANPRSSARGWHQFEGPTWLAEVKKYRPDLMQGKSEQEILNLRGNKDISTEITIDYAKDNAQIFKAAGVQPTGGNLLLAHFLGPKGALNVLNAPGGDPVAMHMSPETVDNNPWVKGLTVDQFQRTMEIKANGGRVTSTGEGTDNRTTRGSVISSDPQYREIAQRLLDLHPGAPGLTFSNGRGQVEKQPTDNPWVQGFQELAQYAAAILAASAVSGSKKGRMTSIGAMGALANAINGVTEGNQQKYKNNIAKFEAETKRMAEQNKIESDQYKLILEKYKDDQGALLGALRAKALELQDRKVEESINHGDATLAETIAFHRAEMQHWADQVAAKAEPVLHNPDQDIYFSWMKEFKEQNGREPTAQERQQFYQQQLKEKKEASSSGKTDPRSAFFKTWHDKFVEDNGREPTSEEWGSQESKWKEASATARSLSPAQQEQQRQITAAQSTLQQLTDGKDVALPGGQKLTAQEWNEFQNLPAGSPMTPKQQQVMVPLLRQANKRLEQQDTSQAPAPSTTQWTPPEGAKQGTPEMLSRFQDGDTAEANGKLYRVDKQHGYFIPMESPQQNPTPG